MTLKKVIVRPAFKYMNILCGPQVQVITSGSCSGNKLLLDLWSLDTQCFGWFQSTGC